MNANNVVNSPIPESINGVLPDSVRSLFTACKSLTWFNTPEEILEKAAHPDMDDITDVSFQLPDGTEKVEAQVMRVKNGLSANYMESYMRRRDPECMVIADDNPTDKVKFSDRFGYDFQELREETFSWLMKQELAAFAFSTGRMNLGAGALVIAPANCGFFAYGLSLLQGILSEKEIGDDFDLQSIIYVAPPFRHTHFEGRQVVVHHRGDKLHELFSYNLYPGPSAKKGIYGVLIGQGEREGWVTAHCAAAQVISPYDNVTTVMHEGASGGGKSEMLQYAHRQADGRILLGENLETGVKRMLQLPRSCEIKPVADDMALCHPSLPGSSSKLKITDAENAWFVRVNHIDQYGIDPQLESLTIHNPEPLLFLNIDSTPGSTSLIWEHIQDAPGVPCPNPRVIVPRNTVPNVLDSSVEIDVRSFGVRTPPCSKERPTYGILGLFHLLPPALAWLWRLTAPRGHGNPSIVDQGGMTSEGVGSYWPFATGRRVTQANLLLEQFVKYPDTCYTLTPNQHVGIWKTGFMPQWLMREYLARRGNADFRAEQYQPARCNLLGYELNYMVIEGEKIPERYLKVYQQQEVGTEGYDQGAEIFQEFFRKQLSQYLVVDLDPLGRQIIECCLDRGSVHEFERFIPKSKDL